LAWRMVDEDVAHLSPSTVYRILKGENLVCPWRRRKKRDREDEEKAKRPNEIWATDLKYVAIGERNRRPRASVVSRTKARGENEEGPEAHCVPSPRISQGRRLRSFVRAR
jgi:hypothetical protein